MFVNWMWLWNKFINFSVNIFSRTFQRGGGYCTQDELATVTVKTWRLWTMLQPITHSSQLQMFHLSASSACWSSETWITAPVPVIISFTASLVGEDPHTSSLSQRCRPSLQTPPEIKQCHIISFQMHSIPQQRNHHHHTPRYNGRLLSEPTAAGSPSISSYTSSKTESL